MKLYIKIPTIEIFRNIEKILPYRDSVIKTKINLNSENIGEIIDYKTNILTLEYLKEFFIEIPFFKNINGIYFGSETCENLMPTINELEEVYNYCKEKHLNMGLMTPPIINKMATAESLLDFISDKDIEIIANDFGTIELVKEKKMTNSVIMGRLLSKRQKNPMMKLYEPVLNDERFCSMEISVEEYGDLIKGVGINRVSVDGDYNFTGETLFEKSFYKDYYFPNTYLSMMSKCNLGDECHRQCEHTNVHYNSYNKNKTIFQRANGIYFINYNFEIPKDFIKKRRNRLIYEVWL